LIFLQRTQRTKICRVVRSCTLCTSPILIQPKNHLPKLPSLPKSLIRRSQLSVPCRFLKNFKNRGLSIKTKVLFWQHTILASPCRRFFSPKRPRLFRLVQKFPKARPTFRVISANGCSPMEPAQTFRASGSHRPNRVWVPDAGEKAVGFRYRYLRLILAHSEVIYSFIVPTKEIATCEFLFKDSSSDGSLS